PLRSRTRQRVVVSLVYGFVSCSKEGSTTRRPLYQELRGDGGGGDPVSARRIEAFAAQGWDHVAVGKEGAGGGNVRSTEV
ncbi:unnamed protein product, partial [Urochloa humidicola]